jgi:antirestriction protein
MGKVQGTTGADKPRVYVGTYKKYNEGKLTGKWLTLTDYSSLEEFLAACRKLHKDERDPELMFQDFEFVPKSMIGESYIAPDLWDWLAMEEDEKKLLKIYRRENPKASLQEAQDAFLGTFDSEAAWAEQYVEDNGLLDGIKDDELKNCIDYEHYATLAGTHRGVNFEKSDDQVWVFQQL